MSLISAKATMRELATKAQAVVGDDSLTGAEKKTSLDLIDADIKSAKEEIDLHNRMALLMAGAESGEGDEQVAKAAHEESTKSVGQLVIGSPEYKDALQRKNKAMVLELKAAATIDEGIIPAFSGGAGLGGQLTAPQFLPGIVPLKFQPLTVADLLAQGTTESSAVTYVVEAAFQDLTGMVLEKGVKPQLDLTLARRQDNVAKIANVAKITDEMFQDAPQF